jgi:hypothetical protein
MKKLIFTLFIISNTYFSFCQEFNLPLYFEDALGNKDTIVFGFDSQATTGIDLSFGEQNIKGIPFTDFDVRISNNSFPSPFGGDSAHFYPDSTGYQTKKQIYNYDSTNGSSISIFAINIFCKHFPIKIKWEHPQLFDTDGKFNTLITNWNPNGWPDVNSSICEEFPTFLRVIDSAEFDVIPHCFINSTNDTMQLLYFAFIPKSNIYYYGIDDVSDNLYEIKLTPTISNGKFNIYSEENFFTVDVYDVYGNSILSKAGDLNAASIDLSGNAQGFYLINVRSKKYQKTFKVVLN